MARTKKYKLQSSSRSKITKKDKSTKLIHKKYNKNASKNTSRNTIKYRKARTIHGFKNVYNINRKIKKTQKGGFFSYFKNLYQMFKFNKLVKQMNQSDTKMAKDFENYKNQTKIIKDMADRTAAETTNYIINYRKQSILKILKKDRNVYKKNQVTFDRNIAQSEQKDISIEKAIIQLDKELNKAMPNFNKLTNIFNKNADNFMVIVEKFSDMSGYRTKLNVKQAQHAILVEDKDKVNKKYKSDIKEYERNKGEFEKFISFDDTYVENLNKKVQEIDDQIKTAQFYIDQFGSLSKEKTSKLKYLKKWKKVYEDIYEEMRKTIDAVKKISNNMDDLRQKVDAIKFASTPIFKDFEHGRSGSIDGLNYFFKDLDNEKGDNSLKNILAVIGKDITQLRLEFIKETPASMISIDYNVGEISTNFVAEKLRAYQISIETALKDQNPSIGGGTYYLEGGRGSRSRGSRSRGRGTGSGSHHSGSHHSSGRGVKKCGVHGYTDNIDLTINDNLYKKACINTIDKKMKEFNNILKNKSEIDKIDKTTYTYTLKNLYSLWFIFMFHKNSENLDRYMGTPDFIGSKYVYDKMMNHLNNIGSKFDDSNKIALITMYNNFNYDIGKIDIDLLKVNVGEATLEDIFHNPTYDSTPHLSLSVLETALYKYRQTTYTRTDNSNFYDFILNAINSTTSNIYTVENNFIPLYSNLKSIYNSLPIATAPIVNAVATAIATSTAATAASIAAASASSASSGLAVVDPNKAPRTVSIDNTLLKNIIAAIRQYGDKYKLQYDTIVTKSKEIYDLLDKVLGDNGDLKQLSNNIQNITQKLIELKYMEPKLISVKVKNVDTLYGQYSWILETAKDVGKEFPVLAETKALYSMIKENAKKAIDKEGGLSDTELNTIATMIVGNPQSFMTDSEFVKKLVKISHNEKDMAKLVNAISSSLRANTNLIGNKNACDIFISLVSIVGRDAIYKNIIDNITNVASRYTDKDGKNPCNPTNPYNPFNQSQGSKPGKQTQGRGSPGYQQTGYQQP